MVNKSLLVSRLYQFLDNDGIPLVAGQLYLCQAGSTAPVPGPGTLLYGYTTADGNAYVSNPVILDSQGRTEIWVEPSTAYDLYLYEADGTTLLSTSLNVVGHSDGAVPPIGTGSLTLAMLHTNTANTLAGFSSVDGSGVDVVPITPLTLSGNTLSCTAITTSQVPLLNTTYENVTSITIPTSSLPTATYINYIGRLTNFTTTASCAITVNFSFDGGSTFLSGASYYDQIYTTFKGASQGSSDTSGHTIGGSSLSLGTYEATVTNGLSGLITLDNVATQTQIAWLDLYLDIVPLSQTLTTLSVEGAWIESTAPAYGVASVACTQAASNTLSAIKITFSSAVTVDFEWYGVSEA